MWVFPCICRVSARTWIAYKRALQSNLGVIISPAFSVPKFPRLCPSKARRGLSASSYTRVCLIDTNGSFACVFCGERALWMLSPTSRLKGWAGKQNIALLFILITPVFINQISCDEGQASRQHDSADGEHVSLISMCSDP